MQTLHILDHRARLVALESETTADVLGLVKNIYADVAKAFTGFTSQFSADEPGLNLNPQQRQLVGMLHGKSYVNLEGRVCYVPEGLSVPFLDYVQTLQPAVDRCSKIMDQSMAPFAGFLAGLVNNHNLAGTATKLKVLDPAHDAQRRQINKDLGACFAAGASGTEQPYQKVVARNNDWPHVFHTTDAMVQAINRVDRKALQKKMHECVDLMAVLQRQIEEGKFGDMSPAVASNLAGGAFQVASELEFYSAIYYKVAALSSALNRTVASLVIGLSE